jgi:hypothetical protein
VESPLPQREDLFNAFRVVPQRRLWPWFLLVFAVLLLAGVVVQSQRERRFEIVTPRGIAVISSKMQQTQVSQVLGSPISPAHDDGCLLYGHPKLDAQFWLYSVCYADGKVKSAAAKPFETHRVEDGVIR